MQCECLGKRHWDWFTELASRDPLTPLVQALALKYCKMKDANAVNRAVFYWCRTQCGAAQIPDLIYERQGQTHKKVVSCERTNKRWTWDIDESLKHLFISFLCYQILERQLFTFFSFGCLVNHLKLLWIQHRTYDKMRQVNCVLHEWLILPDVLLHLQLHLHIRHVTLTDIHNENPESLRKCCIRSGTVHLRSNEIHWRKT